MNSEALILFVFIYLLDRTTLINCSVGDTYPTYRSCVTECIKSTCENGKWT